MSMERDSKQRIVFVQLPEMVLGGIAIGLMASGLYSGGKTMLGA